MSHTATHQFSAQPRPDLSWSASAARPILADPLSTSHAAPQGSGLFNVGETDEKENRPAALVSRNIILSGKRTSIRLEPSMWDALEEICVREQCNIHQICTLVSSRLSCSSFTAAVRVFVLSYYRAATTELGHAAAGHGQLRGQLKGQLRGIK